MLLCQRNELISISHKNTFYVKPQKPAILMSNSQNNLVQLSYAMCSCYIRVIFLFENSSGWHYCVNINDF